MTETIITSIHGDILLRILDETSTSSEGIRINLADKDTDHLISDMDLSKDRAINHLEAVRTSMREEILLRIKQRDDFSNYLAVALGTIVTLSFTTNHVIFLLAAPFASIYFTSMIIHSYEIHVSVMQYLRGIVEPQLAELCGTPPENEWEKFYTTRKKSGIRRSFFISAMWFVCLASPLYVLIIESKTSIKLTILALLFFLAIYYWESGEEEIDIVNNFCYLLMVWLISLIFLPFLLNIELNLHLFVIFFSMLSIVIICDWITKRNGEIEKAKKLN